MAAASPLGPPRLRASSAVRSVSGMQHAYLQAPNAQPFQDDARLSEPLAVESQCSDAITLKVVLQDQGETAASERKHKINKHEKRNKGV